jgi:hypothetical protein
MAEFSVEISEAFVKVINIEAQTEQKAILQAMEEYHSGKITTEKDMKSITFSICKPPKIYISKAQFK